MMKKVLLMLMMFFIFFVSCGETGEIIPKEVPITIYKTQESDPIIYTVIDGNLTIDKELMIREGYEFIGFFDQLNGGTMFINQNGEISLDIRKPITLFGQWDAKEYNIVLDSKEGELLDLKNIITYPYDIEIATLPVPVREGYDFVGWFDELDKQYTDKDGFVLDELKIFNYNNYQFDLENNFKLYAKYELKLCKVVFDYNDGSYRTNLKEFYYGTVINESEFPELEDDGEKRMIAWSTHQAQVVPLDWEIKKDVVLYAIWERYKKANLYLDEENLLQEIEVIQNNGELELPVPSKKGYNFMGWYPSTTFSGFPVSKVTYGTIEKEYYARWEPITYKVTYKYGIDNQESQTFEYKYEESFELIEGTHIDESNMLFTGWKVVGGLLNDNVLKAKDTVSNLSEIDNEEILLVANMASYYYFSVEEVDQGGKITLKSGRIVDKENHTITEISKKELRNKNKIYLVSGDTYLYSVSYNGDQGQTYSFNKNVSKAYDALKLSFYFIMISEDVSIKIISNNSCIVSNTLITLSDGTTKKVEDLSINDSLLVFNHETGKFDCSPILFIENDGWKNYEVISLEFSNGTITKIIDEHGFFDLTLNKYVYIDETNYLDFIGHQFAIVSEENNFGISSVTLLNASKNIEYIGCYSLVTAYHLNFFVDGLFSMPGGIEGIFNIFEYNQYLKYDEELMKQDILIHGLYTYEDFKDYISYDIYCAFPTSYFKVSVGKELITFEEIVYLIEKYLVKHGLA